MFGNGTINFPDTQEDWDALSKDKQDKIAASVAEAKENTKDQRDVYREHFNRLLNEYAAFSSMMMMNPMRPTGSEATLSLASTLLTDLMDEMLAEFTGNSSNNEEDLDKQAELAILNDMFNAEQVEADEEGGKKSE